MKLLLIPVALALAVVTGGVVAFVSQFVYLVVMFPLVMGAIAAFCGMLVHTKSLRLVAMLIGLLCGVVIYGSYRVGEYLIDRQKTIDKVTSQTGADPAMASKLLDQFLKADTGYDGFIGYVISSAREGIQITRATSSTGIKLDEKATWIYWIIELIIVVALGASGGLRGRQVPSRPQSVPPTSAAGPQM